MTRGSLILLVVLWRNAQRFFFRACQAFKGRPRAVQALHRCLVGGVGTKPGEQGGDFVNPDSGFLIHPLKRCAPGMMLKVRR